MNECAAACARPGVDLVESAWKKRFVARLAGLFVQGGLDADCASADAEAHAHHQYLRRATGEPEHEADAVHQWLLLDEA